MSVTNLTEIARRDFKTITRFLDEGIKNWSYAIARNLIPGVDFIDKFGRDPSAAAGEVVQDEGGTITINTAASTVEVISSATEDNPSGSGAKAVCIFGVDINWNPIQADLATNGQSASLSTTLEFLYVYRARTISSGAQRNAGDITIRKSGAGATMAQITIGLGQTEKAVFPVFAGCDLFVNKFRMEGSKTGVLTGEVALVEYELNEGIRVIHPIPFSSGEPQIVEWDETPKVFTEKTLVWVEMLSVSTGAIITASFDGILIRHTDSSIP